MTSLAFDTTLLHLALFAGLSVRILLRDDMLPSSRMAWIFVLATVPFAGALLYGLFGEVDIGHRDRAVHEAVFARLRRKVPEAFGDPRDTERLPSDRLRPAARYGASVNGFQTTPGNLAELAADERAAAAAMVADVDAARESVHALFYIWLDDHAGTAMARALVRAARRGVACRVMVDGLGSRALTRSALWREMAEAGVQTAIALPLDRPIRTLTFSRLDLRNHRKILVIDGRIGWCGSQNCADPEFRIKAKYAPWVDIMLRLRGPVVAQMQLLFASDWMKETGAQISDFSFDAAPQQGGVPAQALGDGPTERQRASPQMFSTLIDSARRQLTITTPYFVPDITVLEALCAAALRGVRVSLVVPRRNDSWVVAAASRSFYRRLLQSGVRIFEFREGLLHAKTLTVDGRALFMGSSNMDMRSFDLNYENDVLIEDPVVTDAVCTRQDSYIERSDAVDLESVLAWPVHRRIWHNVIATLGPLL